MKRGLSLLVAKLLNLIYPLMKKIPVKFLPVQIENMMALLTHTGRHLQRYDSKGCRQIVGCIPYRYRKTGELPCVEEMEVLLISSQNGNGMLFPKGGWEINESMEDAAKRETLEEAGVTGNVEDRLGKWRYKSKSRPVVHEGYMFSLLVNKQFDLWPEKNNRERRWASVTKAREVCQQWWMREALDELVPKTQNSPSSPTVKQIKYWEKEDHRK
ncbi:hypothetical protein ACFE04_007407 [Oxalis oulophora]